MDSSSSPLMIDSNFFIALFNPDDSLHEKAQTTAQKIIHSQQSYALTNYIFLEIVTVLSQKRGKARSRTIGNTLLQSARIIHIDEWLHQHTWSIFCNVHQKDISFVDCSTIAAMKSEGITTLLTFDAQFKKLQKHHRFSLYR